MARSIKSVLEWSAMLECQTPLHVGGADTEIGHDLTLARNGRGEPYIPGTALAGPLRDWTRTVNPYQERELWGYQDPSNGRWEGRASRILVEDAVLELQGSAVVETRHGVGIDRATGTAAHRFKYDRDVVPRGTQIPLKVSIECGSNDRSLEESFLRALAQHLEIGRIRLGAGKTRGLGKVKLVPDSVSLEHRRFDTRAAFLQMLRDGPGAHQNALPGGFDVRGIPELKIFVSWAPLGKIMVKAEVPSAGANAMPLVSQVGSDQVAFVVPGSGIKGALRAHSERIVRTLLGGSAAGNLLNQVSLPLVNDLFGASSGGRAPSESPGSRGALFVDDCYSSSNMPVENWVAATTTTSDRFRKTLDDKEIDAEQVFHIAIDRWTGGVASGRLFAVLEPQSQWEEIEMTLDIGMLTQLEDLHVQSEDPRAHSETSRAAVTLLLLVLRDLAGGRIPIGYATNRGLGYINVKKISVEGLDLETRGGDDGLLSELAEIAASSDLLRRAGKINAFRGSWTSWVESRKEVEPR